MLKEYWFDNTNDEKAKIFRVRVPLTNQWAWRRSEIGCLKIIQKLPWTIKEDYEIKGQSRPNLNITISFRGSKRNCLFFATKDIILRSENYSVKTTYLHRHLFIFFDDNKNYLSGCMKIGKWEPLLLAPRLWFVLIKK